MQLVLFFCCMHPNTLHFLLFSHLPFWWSNLSLPTVPPSPILNSWIFNKPLYPSGLPIRSRIAWAFVDDPLQGDGATPARACDFRFWGFARFESWVSLIFFKRLFILIPNCHRVWPLYFAWCSEPRRASAMRSHAVAASASNWLCMHSIRLHTIHHHYRLKNPSLSLQSSLCSPPSSQTLSSLFTQLVPAPGAVDVVAIVMVRTFAAFTNFAFPGSRHNLTQLMDDPFLSANVSPTPISTPISHPFTITFEIVH
jgi:hypothetical protein